MTLPRLYPILDVALLERRGLPAGEAAQAILDAGAGILQWRSKSALTRAALSQLDEVNRLCGRSSIPLIVNDRADALLMTGAAGLHVGQQDLPAHIARELIGPSRLLGLSTHNARQIEAASGEPVDYIAVGPVFPTSSKSNPDPELGISQFRQWRSGIEHPVVAIGGITRDNAIEVMDAGADSVAVIGDLYPGDLTPQSIRRRLEEWLNLIG